MVVSLILYGMSCEPCAPTPPPNTHIHVPTPDWHLFLLPFSCRVRSPLFSSSLFFSLSLGQSGQQCHFQSLTPRLVCFPHSLCLIPPLFCLPFCPPLPPPPRYCKYSFPGCPTPFFSQPVPRSSPEICSAPEFNFSRVFLLGSSPGRLEQMVYRAESEPLVVEIHSKEQAPAASEIGRERVRKESAREWRRRGIWSIHRK